jgi:1-aminocyclopropane-1-carboxylate deaminase
MFDTAGSILQHVELPLLNKHSVQLFIKRDDLIHPIVSGNKWRKLKFNVEMALQTKRTGILTFGGAYSNHLVATAAAAREAGLHAVGVVRGEELDANSNTTLKKCAELGMELVFASREQYALRNDRYFWEELLLAHPDHFIVPEGGANYYGIIGCQEIMKETPNDYDAVYVAQGTTTTSIGVVFSAAETTKVHVVPVLKGFDSVGEMSSMLNYSGIETSLYEDLLENVVVCDEYHFGGYGKYTDELLDSMEQFFAQTGIPFDPIYTGKALFALLDRIEKGYHDGQRILFVHTGGIQGGVGIAQKESRTFF